jgi:crotonobetainyl-CoA:carnitine CoA-transferase CaiB-like acyl-CoA transferase
VRRALDLEDAFAAAGIPGAMVRTAVEWLTHPQGVALAVVPTVEIVKLADGPPVPLAAGGRPLAGLRVLDVTRVLAGPTCARTLAEHGASVLKVSGPALPFFDPVSGSARGHRTFRRGGSAFDGGLRGTA